MLKWKLTENSSTDKPLVIDKTSSKVYVYVRKNITSTTVTDMDENIRTVWRYEEAKVKKLDWNKYYSEIIHDLEMTEVQQTITDMDLQNIETEQTITDMDLRLLELEGA